MARRLSPLAFDIEADFDVARCTNFLLMLPIVFLPIFSLKAKSGISLNASVAKWAHVNDYNCVSKDDMYRR